MNAYSQVKRESRWLANYSNERCGVVWHDCLMRAEMALIFESGMYRVIRKSGV